MIIMLIVALDIDIRNMVILSCFKIILSFFKKKIFYFKKKKKKKKKKQITKELSSDIVCIYVFEKGVSIGTRYRIPVLKVR